MSSDAMISLDGVSKTYLLYPSPASRLKQFLFRGLKNYYRPVEALKPLSLTLHKGETVGIVGRNGSGKSTLLQLICGTLATTTGEIQVHGRVAALLELGAGFNMEFSGRENIYLNGSVMGLTHEQIKAKESQIEQFAAIGHFIEQPVKTYSSGMIVRLAFAIATAVDPDILIVDEALAVGDEAFQRKCYARIRDMQRNGATILFVSHASQAIVDLCDRALLIDRGELLMDATPKQVITAYHKLIYASPDKEPEIRESLRKGAWEHEAASSPAEQGARLSESMTEYPKRGGEISSPMLLDGQGRAVSVFEQGKSYQFRYRFTRTTEAERLRFGMFIKTRTGVELGGAVHEIDALPLHQPVWMQFTFTANMLPGTYFISCGVTGYVGGEELYLHRLVDALEMRVMNPSSRNAHGLLNAGLVDFDFRAVLNTSEERAA